MVELYQQFLLKLQNAYSQTGRDKPWELYEYPFGVTRDVQKFIFTRPLDAWKDMDIIAKEDAISKLMAQAYGENEAMQWMKIAQKSVRRIETQILSKIPDFA